MPKETKQFICRNKVEAKNVERMFVGNESYSSMISVLKLNNLIIWPGSKLTGI